jgi:type I restriction enzyme S subunit
MGLTKYKLGELIERSTVNNKDLKYGTDLIAGVNNDGVFTCPKGNPLDVDLKPYKLVNNGAFVYNPTRIDLGSLAYRTEGFCIVSHLYIIFYLNEKGKELVDPYYLFIYFHRDEFRREVRFRNFGSQRPEFSFSDMADISITLPSIEQQRKFVDVYLALQNNLAAYQSKVEELKLVCDGYIEELRRKMPCEKIGPYIRPCDERNSDLKIKLAQGITNEKEFASPKQVAEAETSAKIVRKGQFAYNRATTRNGEKISIAYRTGEDCVVSSAYQIFEISAKEKLYPEYLMMWYKRSEFDRYARYMSKGSAHEFFEYEDMEEVQIPIPTLDIQKAIASIYNIYRERKAIAAQLKEQLNNLCPILIKGSLETSN